MFFPIFTCCTVPTSEKLVFKCVQSTVLCSKKLLKAFVIVEWCVLAMVAMFSGRVQVYAGIFSVCTEYTHSSPLILSANLSCKSAITRDCLQKKQLAHGQFTRFSFLCVGRQGIRTSSLKMHNYVVVSPYSLTVGQH